MFRASNPLSIEGLSFVELVSPTPSAVEVLLDELGFSRTHAHRDREVDLYCQNDVRILLSREHGTHAHGFAEAHGPAVSAIGLQVENAPLAAELAVRLGAEGLPHGLATSLEAPAVIGMGGSLIYFLERGGPERLLVPHSERRAVPSKGLVRIDHLTDNVPLGALTRWAEFYKGVLGFTETGSFDPRGSGLKCALRSPCGTFAITFHEGKQAAGVQHVAFLTDDIVRSVDALAGEVPLLDIDAEYYRTAFDQVPGLCERREDFERRSILVEGDASGYLLQVFSKKLLGPLFIELIQRHNHASFGEGNFAALFRSIARGQGRRSALA